MSAFGQKRTFPRTLSGKEHRHHFNQSICRHRLSQICRRTKFRRSVGHILIARQEQDWNALRLGILLYCLNEVVAVHLRHLDINDQEIGLVPDDKVPGDDSVFGHKHVIALLAEMELQQITH